MISISLVSFFLFSSRALLVWACAEKLSNGRLAKSSLKKKRVVLGILLTAVVVGYFEFVGWVRVKLNRF